jgi:hypothetical protein
MEFWFYQPNQRFPYFEEEMDGRCHVKRLNFGQLMFWSVTIFEYTDNGIKIGEGIL